MPPSTIATPRVRRRSVLWIALGFLVLCLFLAIVIPGSPIHLSELIRKPPTDDGRSVRQLTRALSDPEPAARKNAAIALGRLDKEAVSALPRLAEVLRTDPDPLVRAAAGDAIRKMAPASRVVVGELAAALKDPEPLVRMNAAMALCRLGEEARPAIPALIAAADDEDNDTDLSMYFVTIRQLSLRAWAALRPVPPRRCPRCSAS